MFLEFCDGRIKFMPGVRCDIAKGMDPTYHKKEDRLFTSNARLCFADLDVDDLETGIAELIACFREYTMFGS